MTFRGAALGDCPLIAELNHRLIRDEGHRNLMTVPELEQRMSSTKDRALIPRRSRVRF